MKFQDVKGRQIEIQLADDYSEVVGWHNGIRIGAISFCHDCGDEPTVCRNDLYITHLRYLDLVLLRRYWLENARIGEARN